MREAKMEIVYPSGYEAMTLAANDKLALTSYDVAQISQLIKNPNQPDTWSVLYITHPGDTYTTDAFSSETVLRIDAFAAQVLYDIGPNASVSTLESLSEDIDDINDEITDINNALDEINDEISSPLQVMYGLSSDVPTAGVDTYTQVKYDTYQLGDNTVYNTTTGRFTPDVAGTYLVSASILIANVAPGEYINSTIYKNGTRYKQVGSLPNTGSEPSGVTCSALVEMNGTTDYLEFYFRSDSATATAKDLPYESYFYAYKI